MKQLLPIALVLATINCGAAFQAPPSDPPKPFVTLVTVDLITARSFADEPGDFPNYAIVERGLYIGGFVNKPPPGTQAVLNLCGAEDPYAKEVKVYRWEPIADDSTAPNIDWLRKQVDFVDQQRRAGRTTYVHCFAGISRSGMVVTAYLMEKNGWSRDDALAYVRKSRPIRPNPAFMKRLEEWEKAVKDKRR